ncbi:MAG: CHASE2 domain-containing protein [Chthoniobacterales bacterium]
MFSRRIAFVGLLTLLCAASALWLELRLPASYLQMEYRVRDALTRAGRTAAPNPDLVFLAIDASSVTLDQDLDLNGLFPSAAADAGSRRALELMAHGWPWSREIYRLILQRLLGAGAKVVAFDCLFPKPASGDDAFRAALERFPGQVVIGSNFISPEDVDRTRRVPSTYEPPAETLIPASSRPDDRVGFTNFFSGEDNLVRGAQFRVAFREDANPAANYLSLAARVAAKAGHAGLVPADLAEHLIRFTGPPRRGFAPHSLFEIFVPEYWEHNYRSGELLRDKIVIIGAEGKWQKDEIATAFGQMPGAELHLNALNALLRRDFLGELPLLPRLIMAIFAALAGAAICLTIRSPWLRLLALTGLDLAGPFAALGAYNYAGVYLPALAPLLALNATVLFGLVSDFALEQIEKARLRSTLKARDEFTHMIVHDLRSPLTAVRGYVDALEQMSSVKFTPREEKFIAGAKRGATRLQEMISTLLDVSRLEAGRMPLHLEMHDLTAIVRQAVAPLSALLQGRTLLCQLAPAPVLLRCDAAIIQRVLENLLSNAIKFTKPDGKITVALELDHAVATLVVADDGPGIPTSEHKHVFEKFGQTAGGQAHRHSSGLGLAFCRLALEAHGGAIGLQSEVGKGSTFRFTLPLLPETRLETPGHLTSAPALGARRENVSVV